jgi:RHS repeat-associated protein
MTNQNLTYHYGADNRLQYFGNTSFNYDNDGNTISKTGRSLNYDICNNLTSVSGNFNASYIYDGLGNRRSATRNGVTTKYVLDILQEDANVLMETTNNGTAQNYYIYGVDGLVSRIGADGTTTHYYVADYRGSIVAMVSSTSSATVTHRYQYDEFGNVLQSEEADSNPFRYVGKYGLMFETEDLYFVRARYYDPEIGRFLSEDPIWATNLYPYAGNNPIMDIDPSGCISVLEVGRLAIKTIAGGGGLSGVKKNTAAELLKTLLYRTLNNSDGKEALEKKSKPMKRAICKILPNSQSCKNDSPEDMRRQLDQNYAWERTNQNAESEWLKNHRLNDLKSEFAWQNLDFPSKVVVIGTGIGVGIIAFVGIVTVSAPLIQAMMTTSPYFIYGVVK